ncbi:MAG: hypothetical protein Q7T33_03555 [Dehalococcoidia bacterium]|nr:hypothetical protein [Dehalococcoidia bacterium]
MTVSWNALASKRIQRERADLITFIDTIDAEAQAEILSANPLLITGAHYRVLMRIKERLGAVPDGDQTDAV